MGINRLKRLIEMITFIQSNANVTIYDIMNEMGTSRSTAFRDMKVLEDCGIPCSYNQKQGYQISSTFMFPVDTMKPVEVLALSQLLGQLKIECADTTQMNAIKAIQKILASLPQSARDIYQHYNDEHLTVLPSICDAPDLASERLSLLIDAIDNSVPVVCELKRQNHEVRSIRLHPYHLILDQSQWYVWARVFPEGQLKSIEVDRLIHLMQVENQFQYPSNAITQAWRAAWRVHPEGQSHHVEVRVKLSAPERFIATQWHKTQQKNIDRTGCFTLSFDVDGLEENAQWIWQHHHYIEVICPAALKEKVRKHAKELLKSLDD